jgi:acetyl-CoA carboxylase biotin carboxyl carrier protein
MDLSKDDVFKIIKIIEESGYDDVRLEVGDFKVHVQKQVSGAYVAEPVTGARAAPPQTAGEPALKRPAPPSAAAAPATARAPGESVPEGAIVVRAPMLGTFYRSPAPGEKPFVEVGSTVAAEDTICLVEVMKLFNSIKAGTAGTVVKILAENATLVEHGQPLVVIMPK